MPNFSFSGTYECSILLMNTVVDSVIHYVDDFTGAGIISGG